MKVVEPSPQTIEEAGALLRAGGLVAFPTETVYGLGADATSGRAVAGIFAAKGRPRFNPLIVHVPDLAAAERLAVLTESARRLAATFWPGPLTLVLPRRPDSGISELATAGLDTVAIRVPDHPVAQALLRAAGVPIAAPSANRSGHVSPTTAAHVAADFAHAEVSDIPSDTVDGSRDSSCPQDSHSKHTVVRPRSPSTAGRGQGWGEAARTDGITPVDSPHPRPLPSGEGGAGGDTRVSMIIDGGPTAHGVESTVLDASGGRIVMLRPGAVTAEAIETVIGARLARATGDGKRPISPGQLASHYAPRARLRLNATHVRAGEALLAFGQEPLATRGPAINLSPAGELIEAATNLFAALRTLDATGAAAIAVMAIPEHGLGEAINDRLRRAAAGR